MTQNDAGHAKPKRTSTPSRARLIGQMFRVLGRQITQLESEHMTQIGDKEVALLGNMVRSLDKLIELDNEEKAKKPRRTSSRQIGDLREKLAARIDQLKRD